jgi:hypothetical protein
LHTLGGVVGALTARPKKLEAAPIPTATVGKPHVEPKYSATGLYWIVVLLVSGFAVTWDIGSKSDPDVVGSLFLVGFVLPVIQVIAIVIALVVVLLSRRPGREQRMLHLARIGARGLIGAVLGVLVMLPFLKAC